MPTDLTALLLDYGNVISLDQPLADRLALERVAPDVPAVAFWSGYWAHRLDYDRGLAAAEYWSAVLGRPTTGPEVDQLTELDNRGWSHVDERWGPWLAGLRQRGVRLGLLSNCPAPMARLLERQEWAAPFDALTFSCDVGVAKPDAQAYVAACAALRASPAEVVFVDDREVNVAGAREAGLSAVLHADVGATLAELDGRLAG